MPVNDVIEAVVVSQQQEQAGLCVLHYRVASVTPPEPTILSIATQLDSELHVAWKAMMNGVAQYLGVSAQRVFPLPPGLRVGASPNSGPGTALGEAMPKQVTGFVKRLSFAGGRRGRGRNYIPFPAEGDNDADSTPTAGYIGRLDALASILDNVITVTEAGGELTLQPGVFSRTAPITIFDVAVVESVDRWATQRRRGDFGRTNIPSI